MNLPPKNTPSASNVHEARDTLGKRLRELRQRASLTGTQLAESLSWPQSKISKLETARQTPSEDDIRAWTRATGCEPQTDELLTALHTLEAQHAEWQRVLRPGMQAHQSKLSELDAKTRLFCVFEATVVPGLLQTAEYARTRLAQGVI
ncbi:MAG: helix-turn-helix transcriptional regulator, partial [Actinobacteria bacterium]|nr:helix-turn-helix transcriptional regulator [Actinomycetota bacterium]